MEIQSAYASGLQGLQRASSGITEATVNINREAVNQQRVQNAQEANARAQQAPQPAEQPAGPAVPSLQESLVQLNTESLYAEANVRSIRTADEVLGTLIDVSA
jgi:hypothetical protein